MKGFRAVLNEQNYLEGDFPAQMAHEALTDHVQFHPNIAHSKHPPSVGVHMPYSHMTDDRDDPTIDRIHDNLEASGWKHVRTSRVPAYGEDREEHERLYLHPDSDHELHVQHVKATEYSDSLENDGEQEARSYSLINAGFGKKGTFERDHPE